MILDETFDYEKACAYIERSSALGSRPGLERIKELCALLGSPESHLRFIHIAGTNGKGSTGAMIASALKEAGLKVGYYYSPAISGITDHYMINNELISEEEYALCVSTVMTANEEMIAKCGESATQFELETAVAYVYFYKNHCDVVVLECGMGGRDDATNTVTDKICAVITSVSLDHTQYLGDTLEKIASVKAGIITKGCPVIALDSGAEVTGAIRNRCKETGSSLYIVHPGDKPADVRTSLCGSFQEENAALAYKTLSVIRDNELIPGAVIKEDDIRRGLENVRWPFRFETISTDPLIYIDGAHNADAAIKLKETVDEYLGGYKMILVIGMFSDKDYESVVRTLSGIAEMIFTVETPDNPRALPSVELAAVARKYCDNVYSCSGIKEAYDKAKDAALGMEKAAVLACGSLSYLNIFRKCGQE